MCFCQELYQVAQELIYHDCNNEKTVLSARLFTETLTKFYTYFKIRSNKGYKAIQFPRLLKIIRTSYLLPKASK